MPYGHDKNTLWISLANPGGFPISADDEKNDAIRQFVIENDIDVHMWTETDKHWQSLEFKDWLLTRTASWYEALHMTTAYYKAYPGSVKQHYSGVSLWSTRQAAHQVQDAGIDMAAGVDLSGLGQWAWTWHIGCNSVSLQVSHYRTKVVPSLSGTNRNFTGSNKASIQIPLSSLKQTWQLSWQFGWQLVTN
jgi:hypothetical protein